MRGLPPDNGLYLPTELTPLPESFWNSFPEMSFSEMALAISMQLCGDQVPYDAMKSIVEGALTFDAPLVQLEEDIYVLELFHGPTLAFKDFGARFMARIMGYFLEDNADPLTILVATSGDTGGAVASGFHNTPGIEVVILYPSGMVSPLQEKQLTTLGGNITALEVQGTFDDCQRMVKEAFLDEELRSQRFLSSANSINLARLVPQSWYYFRAIQQLGRESAVMCIPSGNFGNLTAGILAKRLGLGISHFLAATNTNDVVPQYLRSGKYEPRVSASTLSNAMDVGNPSNFARMIALHDNSHAALLKEMSGGGVSDEDTLEVMKEVYERTGYVLDPHGAVGYQVIKEAKAKGQKGPFILFETAHPAKFADTVQTAIGREPDFPERLLALQHEEKVATLMPAAYGPFREWLLKG